MPASGSFTRVGTVSTTKESCPWRIFVKTSKSGFGFCREELICNTGSTCCIFRSVSVFRDENNRYLEAFGKKIDRVYLLISGCGEYLRTPASYSATKVHISMTVEWFPRKKICPPPIDLSQEGEGVARNVRDNTRRTDAS